MAALKKVFLKFAKKPDGSYEPSVSKQKTAIGAFLIPSGHFDNTGINANGKDIDGIRTVLADFFTKSPYTVQGTPLFFFEGTNNLVANVTNVMGTSLSVKAGFGSFCIFSHLTFGSIKSGQTIGRFQIDGTTAYCNCGKIQTLDGSFITQVLSNGNRLLSYVPPSSVDIANETVKITQYSMGTYSLFFEYTNQGILKVMRRSIPSSQQYSSVTFVNSPTLQNNNDPTIEVRYLNNSSFPYTLTCPVPTNSFVHGDLAFTFPKFTTVSYKTATYDVSYLSVSNINTPRLFANMGIQTVANEKVEIISLANKIIDSCTFVNFTPNNVDAANGLIFENIIFPKINSLRNENMEFSSVCNVYTGHYAFAIKDTISSITPYKMKLRCGFIIKFPPTIDGSIALKGSSTDACELSAVKISPFASGRVIYVTDQLTPGKYLYETYNVAIGILVRNVNGSLTMSALVSYDDNSFEKRDFTVSSSTYLGEAYFNLISDGTHFSSIPRSSLNCLELNEGLQSGVSIAPINDFSASGVLLTPNVANKKIVKIAIYMSSSFGDNMRLENLFLILSPKT